MEVVILCNKLKGLTDRKSWGANDGNKKEILVDNYREGDIRTDEKPGEEQSQRVIKSSLLPGSSGSPDGPEQHVIASCITGGVYVKSQQVSLVNHRPFISVALEVAMENLLHQRNVSAIVVQQTRRGGHERARENWRKKDIEWGETIGKKDLRRHKNKNEGRSSSSQASLLHHRLLLRLHPTVASAPTAISPTVLLRPASTGSSVPKIFGETSSLNINVAKSSIYFRVLLLVIDAVLLLAYSGMLQAFLHVYLCFGCWEISIGLLLLVRLGTSLLIWFPI
ncbi:hypothetical protein POTOM_028204 [Populus tomentosa]|uniref:Uncharacterized protein n=1 Tax=Populus tomentosa TaxID=118781 RepID=A0A8X7ZE19_POPTO|nr:hypothetical protein POTOM_028204 [Populus tomentosa]